MEKWVLTRETIGSETLSVVMPFYRLAASAGENLKAVAELFEGHGIRRSSFR